MTGALHRAPALTADLAEVRYAHLLACGFDRESADKIFEALDLPEPAKIDQKLADLRDLGFADPVKMITSLPAILGLAIDNIRGKLTDLRDLGFADPVKMITSLPAILGYARERVLLCGGIVAGLSDRKDAMLARLISMRRTEIEGIAARKPQCWADVLSARKGLKSALRRAA
jgi:hypothetical protein